MNELNVLETRIHEATNYLEACQSLLTITSTDQWQNIIDSYHANREKVVELIKSDSRYTRSIIKMEKDLTGFINKLIGIKHKSSLFKQGKSESIEKALSVVSNEWQTFLLGLNDKLVSGKKTSPDLLLEGLQFITLEEQTRGILLIEESFKMGNKSAAIYLAKQCKNIRDGEFYLRDVDHPYALLMLGDIDKANNKIERAIEKWEKALELLKTSQIPYGMKLTLKLKIAQNSTDVDKVYSLLEENIKQQHPESINYLGFLYFSGEVLEKDLKRAFELFYAASELECIEAWCNLGICYESGKGVEVNLQKSMACYSKIIHCQSNSTAVGDANCNLGYLYYKQGNFNEALLCLSRAIALHCSDAITILNNVIKGIAQDPMKLQSLEHDPLKSLHQDRKSEQSK